MITFEDQWKEIKNEFNWKQVKVVMQFLKWRWISVDIHNTPSITQIKETALDLLKDVYNNSKKTGETSTSSTGGLEAICCLTDGKPSLELRFILESWDTFDPGKLNEIEDFGARTETVDVLVERNISDL